MNAQLCPQIAEAGTDGRLRRRTLSRDDSRAWARNVANDKAKSAKNVLDVKPEEFRRKPRQGGALDKPARVHHNQISTNFVFYHVKPTFHCQTKSRTIHKKGTPQKMPIFFRQLEAPTLNE